jgi:hypothetical protein
MSPMIQMFGQNSLVTANPSIQGTPEKLRFSVPSRVPRSVAPDLER